MIIDLLSNHPRWHDVQISAFSTVAAETRREVATRLPNLGPFWRISHKVRILLCVETFEVVKCTALLLLDHYVVNIRSLHRRPLVLLVAYLPDLVVKQLWM